jgi:hypothetical protein
MERTAVAHIREAVEAAREIAQAAPDFDTCDTDDIEEIVEPVRQELEKAQPNAQTLATYLNSLARSLRAYPPARSVCLRLDAAMREAGLTTDWEH